MYKRQVLGAAAYLAAKALTPPSQTGRSPSSIEKKARESAEITSSKDSQGNTVYRRGNGKVVVLKGVTVRNTKGGNTISDILTVSEAESKTVNVISGYRTQAKQNLLHAAEPHLVPKISKHTTEVAVDLQIAGYSSKQTAHAAYNAGVFNRVSSYNNRNTAHVDYNTTKPQGLYYHWEHQKQ